MAETNLTSAGATPHKQAHSSRASQTYFASVMPISKLRSVPASARWALKIKSINTSAQLLAAAGGFEQREALAAAVQVAPALLTAIVRRADLARVKGLGVRFAQMLEEIGIHDVAAVAEQDPIQLHDHLRRHNEQERLCRRSPTLIETIDWVQQARALPTAVYYRSQDFEAATGKGRLQAD